MFVATKPGAPAPTTASAHVRVIEDQTESGDTNREKQEPEAPEAENVQIRSGGFHVRAVPIDQPFDEVARKATPESPGWSDSVAET